MNNPRLDRYLYLLREQYTANRLGFGSTWTEGMTEMDSLWNTFSEEQQESVEEHWRSIKLQLDSHVPSAPPTLGMVDQVPGNGVPPRRST